MTIYANPDAWGPPAWIFLHCITLTYPEKPTPEEKERYRIFFYSLGDVLPCKMCRQEYTIRMKKFPIEPFLDSKKTLTQWMIDFHNSVNKRTKKPVIDTRQKALATIRRECKKYNNSDQVDPSSRKKQCPKKG